MKQRKSIMISLIKRKTYVFLLLLNLALLIELAKSAPSPIFSVQTNQKCRIKSFVFEELAKAELAMKSIDKQKNKDYKEQLSGLRAQYEQNSSKIEENRRLIIDLKNPKQEVRELYEGKIKQSRLIKALNLAQKTKIFVSSSEPSFDKSEPRILIISSGFDSGLKNKFQSELIELCAAFDWDKVNSMNCQKINFMWKKTSILILRGLRSRVKNDAYLKDLVEKLYTSENEGEDPKNVYRKNFEKLEVEGNPELKTATELVEKATYLEALIQEYSELAKKVFLVVGVRDQKFSNGVLGSSINYEIFDKNQLNNPEDVSEFIETEFRRFMDFVLRPPIYTHFDLDWFNDLKNKPRRTGFALLYRGKINKDKKLVKNFIETLKEISRQDWDSDPKNSSNGPKAINRDHIFGVVDIMKRLNRPLVKKLNFEFSRFPCTVALKYDPNVRDLKYEFITGEKSMHHLLYPYGFRKKVKNFEKRLSAKINNKQKLEMFRMLRRLIDGMVGHLKLRSASLWPIFGKNFSGKKFFEMIKMRENQQQTTINPRVKGYIWSCPSTCAFCLKLRAYFKIEKLLNFEVSELRGLVNRPPLLLEIEFFDKDEVKLSLAELDLP